MTFLCISNYNNDLEWLKEYKNPHIIYDKTWNGGVIDNNNSGTISPTNLKEKYPNYNIINGSPNGYNISDYMSFIIDNYNNLPDVTAFIKANIVPRHIGIDYFNRVINTKCFTPLEDWKEHDIMHNDISNIHSCMFSCDGGLMERNNSWYLNHPSHPSDYFKNYNNFLNFCFKDPVLPHYVRFPPGGNFIVPKEYILKYDKIFYKNLLKFVDYTRVPGEGQMIERALYTIWTCNYEVADTMKKLV